MVVFNRNGFEQIKNDLNQLVLLYCTQKWIGTIQTGCWPSFDIIYAVGNISDCDGRPTCHSALANDPFLHRSAFAFDQFYSLW